MVQNDLKSLHMDKYNAMDQEKWRNLIRGKQVSGDESGDSDWCVYCMLRLQFTWVVLQQLGLSSEFVLLFFVTTTFKSDNEHNL